MDDRLLRLLRTPRVKFDPGHSEKTNLAMLGRLVAAPSIKHGGAEGTLSADL